MLAWTRMERWKWWMVVTSARLVNGELSELDVENGEKKRIAKDDFESSSLSF